MVKQLTGRFQKDNSVVEGTVKDGFVYPFSSDTPFPLNNATILVPCTPTKIVCVGRNFKSHADERKKEIPKEPLLFLKAPSSLLAYGEIIILPPESDRVEFEGEIGVVIGKRCKRILDSEDPWIYVKGITAVNDVTARDLQERDGQFTRSKSFDTFCPVGPFILIGRPAEPISLVTKLGDIEVQKGNSAEMAFPIPFLVRYISRMMTLEEGDVIATGTPAGTAPLEHDNLISIQVDEIPPLINNVKRF